MTIITTIINKIRGLLMYAMPLMFSALIIIGCVEEQPTPPDTNGAVITFSVNVPNGFTPSSYAFDDDKGHDKYLGTVDVLLFDDSGDYVSGPHYGIVNGSNVTVRIPDTDATYTMAVFANCRSKLSGTFSGNKEAVYSSITIDESGKWPTTTVLPDGIVPNNPIPMWGEAENIVVTDGAVSGAVNVSLVRMLARINVANSAGNFDLTKIFVYNYNRAGRVAPEDGNISIDDGVSPPTISVSAPSLPDDPNKETDSDNPLIYPNNTNITAISAYNNEIYVFEADVNSPDMGEKPCLVIEGEYDGGTYYYRIDFVDDSGSSSDYYDLLRNYSYNVAINNINGPGYANKTDALNSTPVNIQYSVTAWNDKNIIETDNRTNPTITPSPAQFSFDAAPRGAGNGDNILSIDTNYPDGWTAEIEYASGSPSNWLNLINMDGSDITTGTQLTATHVKLKLDANDSGSPRLATIKLTAGASTYSVSVMQSNEATVYDAFQPEADSYTMFVAPPHVDKILIPVSRANFLGIKLNSDDVFTVEILGSTGVIGKALPVGVGNGGHIYIEAGTTAGTAKVAIRKEGELGDPLHEWTINVKTPTTEVKSNSYIVAPNSGILIPVARANDAAPEVPAQLGANDVFTAGLVWTDNFKTVSQLSNIRTIAPVGKGNGGYVLVGTGEGEGNAVVAIKNAEGDILWSWHIWVTNYVPSDAGNGFMDRNLGALDNGSPVFGEPTNFTLTDNTVGLQYQWGRKDPFPGTMGITSVGTSGKERPIYYGSGSTIGAGIKNSIVRAGTNTSAKTMEFSVRNPDKFIDRNSNNSDWCSDVALTGENSNRWEYINPSSKSVYDPCPHGWRVPIYDASYWYKDTKDGTGNNTDGGGFSKWMYSVTGYAQRNDAYGGVYPAAGGRNRANGLFIGVGAIGYYWSASPGSSTNSRRLNFNGTDVLNVNNGRAYSSSVRCVQELDHIEVYDLTDSFLLNGNTYTFSLYTDDTFTITPASTTEIASITNSGTAGFNTISFTTNEIIADGSVRDVTFTVNSGGNSKNVVIRSKTLLPFPAFNLFRKAVAYPVKSNGISHRFYVNSPIAWEITKVEADAGINIVTSPISIQGGANVETAVEFTTDGTATIGTVTVTFSTTAEGYYPTATQTLEFGEEYKPKLHRGWAGSNIYYDSSTSNLTFKNTGTNQEGQCLQGVHFKWGSLFGISPSSTSNAWTDTPWVYPPVGGAKTLSEADISTTWTTSSSTRFPHIVTSISNNDDFNSLYYLTNGSIGVGDICRWLTEAGYAPSGAKWRMPTANELLTAFGGLTRQGTSTSSSEEHGVGAIDRHIVNTDYGVYLPASGGRDFASGDLGQSGSCGFYWSSSPSGPGACALTYVSSYGNVSCGDRTYGFTIRCVKE